MPKGDKPTLKQRKFVKAYLENGGNGSRAALSAYNTTDSEVAKVIAAENFTKPNVMALLQQQSEIAALDQIEIREELKQSKKDYAVRSQLNRDILDRTLGKPQQSIDHTSAGNPIGISLDF